jgi:hypothetical protein
MDGRISSKYSVYIFLVLPNMSSGNKGSGKSRHIHAGNECELVTQWVTRDGRDTL